MNDAGNIALEASQRLDKSMPISMTLALLAVCYGASWSTDVMVSCGLFFAGNIALNIAVAKSEQPLRLFPIRGVLSAVFVPLIVVLAPSLYSTAFTAVVAAAFPFFVPRPRLPWCVGFAALVVSALCTIDISPTELVLRAVMVVLPLTVTSLLFDALSERAQANQDAQAELAAEVQALEKEGETLGALFEEAQRLESSVAQDNERAVERELKMLALKRQINEALGQLGQAKRYQDQESVS